MKLKLQRYPDAQVVQYEGINCYRNRQKYYRIIWPAKIYAKNKRKYSKSTTRFGNKFIISSSGEKMEYEKSRYKATTWYPTYKECIKNEDE